MVCGLYAITSIDFCEVHVKYIWLMALIDPGYVDPSTDKSNPIELVWGRRENELPWETKMDLPFLFPDNIHKSLSDPLVKAKGKAPKYVLYSQFACAALVCTYPNLTTNKLVHSCVHMCTHTDVNAYKFHFEVGNPLARPAKRVLKFRPLENTRKPCWYYIKKS